MQKHFLRSYVCRAECHLHAYHANNRDVSYHQYVDSLFASIRTIERNHENMYKVDNSNRIQYDWQKSFGRQPLQTREMISSTIAAAFSKPGNSMATTSIKPHNRCFNCWTPGCLVRKCSKPKNNTCIKLVLEPWKQWRGFPKRVSYYFNLIATHVESDEANKAFITSVVIDKASVIDHTVASSPEREETQDAENIHFNMAALSECVNWEEESEAEILWIMYEKSLDTDVDAKATETMDEASRKQGGITVETPNRPIMNPKQTYPHSHAIIRPQQAKLVPSPSAHTPLSTFQSPSPFHLSPPSN